MDHPINSFTYKPNVVAVGQTLLPSREAIIYPSLSGAVMIESDNSGANFFGSINGTTAMYSKTTMLWDCLGDPPASYTTAQKGVLIKFADSIEHETFYSEFAFQSLLTNSTRSGLGTAAVQLGMMRYSVKMIKDDFDLTTVTWGTKPATWVNSNNCYPAPYTSVTSLTQVKYAGDTSMSTIFGLELMPLQSFDLTTTGLASATGIGIVNYVLGDSSGNFLSNSYISLVV